MYKCSHINCSVQNLNYPTAMTCLDIMHAFLQIAVTYALTCVYLAKYLYLHCLSICMYLLYMYIAAGVSVKVQLVKGAVLISQIIDSELHL